MPSRNLSARSGSFLHREHIGLGANVAPGTTEASKPSSCWVASSLATHSLRPNSSLQMMHRGTSSSFILVSSLKHPAKYHYGGHHQNPVARKDRQCDDGGSHAL